MIALLCLTAHITVYMMVMCTSVAVSSYVLVFIVC